MSPKPLQPCGTYSAVRRHRANSETCADCNEPRPCGTVPAYRQHHRNGETPCAECTEANNNKNRAGQRRTLTTEELIAEVERLLSYGEGWGAILKASGYKNHDSLKERLRRAGRADLNERVFNMEGCVAA